MAILPVFVWCSFDKGIADDLLLCKSSELRSTENNIFNLIDDFMKAQDISWEKCNSVRSDGAKSMTGKINGAITKIKNLPKSAKVFIASSTDTLL